MTRKETKYLWAVMFLSIVLRLLPVFWNNQPPVSDGLLYHQLARSLIETGTYSYSDGTATAYWPPGYPFVLAFLYALKFNLLSVKLFQIILCLVTIWLTFLIGRRLVDVRTGIWAALILAAHPYHIFYCDLILTEILFITLFTASLFFYLKVHQFPNYKDAIFLGLFTGAGILVRPFFLLIPVFFILLSPKQFKPLLLTLFISAIVIAPWTFRNYSIFHRLIPVSSNGGINFWIGHNPKTTGGFHHTGNLPKIIKEANENDQSELAYKAGLDHVTRHPVREAWYCCLKTWWLFMPDYGSLMWAGNLNTGNKLFVATATLLGLYPLILIFAGLWGISDLKFGFLWQGILFYTLCVCWLFFSQPRYLLPFAPLLAISASALVTGQPTPWNSKILSKKRLLSALLIVFIIIGYIYWGSNYLSRH